MQAADQLRRRITLGDVRPGRKLEPTRELARQLGVSLPVVREAMAALAYAGLVEVRHGIGVFVAAQDSAGRQARLERRRAKERDIHLLRETLAVSSARAAATRCTGRRLAEVRLALAERERAIMIGDDRQFTHEDLTFHRAIAQAAGNSLAVAIESAAGAAVSRGLIGRATVLALDQRLRDLHADLVDAIERRRPDLAARLSGRIARLEADPDDPDGHL